MALFDSNGNAVSGNVTGMILLWEAGTEEKEVPGIGPNHAPRPAGVDTGAAEGGTPRQVNDGS